jgi:hypothetical protein
MQSRLVMNKLQWSSTRRDDEKDGSLSATASTTGSVDSAVAMSRMDAPVCWYRRCWKTGTPQSSRRKAHSLRQAFAQLGVVHEPQDGIPMEQVVGFHEMFQSNYLHLSPLIGVIYTHNNFIDNLYRHGDSNEPAVALIRALFDAGASDTCSIPVQRRISAAGSHVSADLIGRLLEGLDGLRPTLLQWNRDIGKLLLRNLFLDCISSDSDYMASRYALLTELEAAESRLAALRARHAQSRPVRQHWKSLRCILIEKCGQVRQLKRELTLATDDETRMELHRDIRRQRSAMDKVKRKMHQLRSQIVTSLDLTSARNDVGRAQDEIEQEEESRVQLVDALVDCFFAYDLDTSPWLPKFTMSTVLLAFMWRKYDTIHDLKGYMGSMARMGALRSTASRALIECCTAALRPRDWSAEKKAAAALVAIRRPVTDYDTFCRLRKFCNHPVDQSLDVVAHFEQLSLASLLVPCSLLMKRKGYFHRFPPHLLLLFADFTDSTQQEAAMRCLSAFSSQAL